MELYCSFVLLLVHVVYVSFPTMNRGVLQVSYLQAVMVIRCERYYKSLGDAVEIEI